MTGSTSLWRRGGGRFCPPRAGAAPPRPGPAAPGRPGAAPERRPSPCPPERRPSGRRDGAVAWARSAASR